MKRRLTLAARILAALLLLLLGLLVAARILCLSSSRGEEASPIAAQQEATLLPRLRQDVEILCAHPRHGDAQARQHAIRHITQRLQEAGWQVQQYSFAAPDAPEAEGGTLPHPANETQLPEGWQLYHNIIATAPGTPPSHSAPGAKRYIIGAHYDSCDTGEPNPGADDNASACAVLLTLADLLSPRRIHPHPSPETPALELVFYACEEPPWFDTEWMGSAVHASHCRPENTLGMICLEMLGYYSDAPCAHPELLPCGLRPLLPGKGDFIAVVGDLSALSLAQRAQAQLQNGMPTLRANLPFAQQTELFFSDHRNYAARRIPSIMVTDTALLRNPHYHEASDTPETLNYHHLARIARNLANLLRQLVQE